jgi:hypothetical protein
LRTYSHFLITAALRKVFPKVPIAKSAVYLGSVAPDIPLLTMSVGGYLYFHYFLQWETRDTFRHLFDVLFFNDPFWIASHNFFQAPFILAVAIVTLWKVHGNGRVLESWWFWFFSACMIHAVIDILTHNDDGPLVFFPLDWTYRFASPVSYWDSDHYASEFTTFENTLDVGLIAYLLMPIVWTWIMRKFRKQG